MPLNLHKLLSHVSKNRPTKEKIKLKNEARENAAQFKRSRKANKRAFDKLEYLKAIQERKELAESIIHPVLTIDPPITLDEIQTLHNQYL